MEGGVRNVERGAGRGLGGGGGRGAGCGTRGEAVGCGMGTEGGRWGRPQDGAGPGEARRGGGEGRGAGPGRGAQRGAPGWLRGGEPGWRGAHASSRAHGTAVSGRAARALPAGGAHRVGAAGKRGLLGIPSGIWGRLGAAGTDSGARALPGGFRSHCHPFAPGELGGAMASWVGGWRRLQASSWVFPLRGSGTCPRSSGPGSEGPCGRWAAAGLATLPAGCALLFPKVLPRLRSFKKLSKFLRKDFGSRCQDLISCRMCAWWCV